MAINDYVNNYGVKPMTDYSIYGKQRKPFCNQGEQLIEFLKTFINTDIFYYLNGIYTPITAQSDGARLYNRVVCKQEELQF